jgi:hypothetical protein
MRTYRKSRVYQPSLYNLKTPRLETPPLFCSPALHLQCSSGEDAAAAQLPYQRLLVGVLAKIWGDNVEAEIKRGLVGDCLVQELARFCSQRHKHSIGMAFINEPMGGGSAEFDGMPWQLALKRAVGVERATEKCNLVLSDKTVCKGRPGGTLHARLCQAKAAKRHDTLVHNRIKYTMQRLLHQYLKVRPEDEGRTPFITSEKPDLRMDMSAACPRFPTHRLQWACTPASTYGGRYVLRSAMHVQRTEGHAQPGARLQGSGGQETCPLF